MKRVLLALVTILLTVSCGTSKKLEMSSLPEPNEVFYLENFDGKGELKWSELYVTQDSVKHRYLYAEDKDKRKILILEISY